MKFSVCIPAYNRAKHLAPLLDSIVAQGYTDYEIVICEDVSRERPLIAQIVRDFQQQLPAVSIRYHENEVNLGYDGNIRRLVELSAGDYCFFMGNDDFMRPDALQTVAATLARHPEAGVVIKAYEWFVGDRGNVQQVIRYVTEETSIASGEAAIVAAFRRVGVISGFVIRRADAAAAATTQFDGSLYYQMYITGSVLARRDVVFIPEVLVSCRGDEPPEFGSSAAEKGKYVPGKYTPEARLNMIGSVFRIAAHLEQRSGLPIHQRIVRDYAYYFFPYIRDQLQLPLRRYFRMYREFGRMGLDHYPMFHLYIVGSYLLGEHGVDRLANFVRRILGRSPKMGGAL